MQKIMVLFASMFLGSSLFASSSRPLAICENVFDADIHQIKVSHLTDFPGNLQVSVSYQDGSEIDVLVGMQEWKQKAFTLPSRRNSSYRLLYWDKKWVLFQDDVSHVNQKLIECSVL